MSATRQKSLWAASAVVLAAFLFVSATADWQPEDGHKMHYPQLPDETGWAVNATAPLILADDFMCTETGWIKDVHFWGAWKGGQEGQIDHFVLSLHTDIPADQNPDGYSKPGVTLYEWEIYDWSAVPIDPPTMEGWYDPLTGETIPEDHIAYFQYNVFLPEAEWYPQDSGTIYWLNISAIVVDPLNTVWGWKSTQDHWNDDAVWAEWGDLSWEEMYEPEVVDTLINDYNIAIDPAGQFLFGSGTGAFGQGWYYYPQEDWWNIWFFDHPLDYDRWKQVVLEYDIHPLDPGQPSFVEVAVNWSLDSWPDTTQPPLPGDDIHIGRAIVYSGEVIPGHYIFPWEIMDYNPVWVSVDVRGFNFEIPFGEITHICAPREPVSMDLSFVITGGPDDTDTCDFYKLPYPDYSPMGMPDFDMKQLAAWVDGNGKWSHDGPAALANCMWWFDSKFEPSPLDPRPFFPSPAHVHNDGFPLVRSYEPTLQWDDHDTNNVQPLIDDLAINYLNTNPGGIGGTRPQDLVNGFRAYLSAWGLDPHFKDSVYFAPTYEFIRDEVYTSQDVILLFSFYEDMGATSSYIGSHWVTTAGVCSHDRIICVSDPYMDALEGEPPAGTAHGPTVHNDALNISGPHGQIQHDPYTCTSTTPPGFAGPVEVVNYPVTATIVNQFTGMNAQNDWGVWNQGSVFVVIDLAYVICPEEPLDTCDYYKPDYGDYAPNGMPDFDQKQSTWIYPPTANWSHCGPVALANCLWWFDSKFEPSPVDPRPFWPGPGNPPNNDGYPLVYSFDPTGGVWDDHDTNNVVPFIDSLAVYCKTNTSASGTNVFDLAQGASDWIDSVGLSGAYNIRVLAIDPAFGFEDIRQEVLASQDVILLLGFYEEISPGFCERIGGHFVTVAGTCTDPVDSFLCISDPYYDANEGEPPAGSAHGSTVHNDAYYVSGPHGTMHHDRYQVSPTTCQPFMPPIYVVELPGYPVNASNVGVWYGQNRPDPTVDPVPPQGGSVHTILEYAVIICPDTTGPPTGACCEQTTGICYITDQATCLGNGHDYKGDGTTCTPNPCDTCDYQDPGDVNNDGATSIADITYLVQYLYLGGPAPPIMANADVNGDCCLDYKDVQYLIAYLYSGGPAPVNCTCVNPPICIPTPPDHTLGIVRHSTDGYVSGPPVGRTWDELYPSFGASWTIGSWVDNGDGTLSWCDTVEFIYDAAGTSSFEHIERVTTTLQLLDNSGGATLYLDRLDDPPNPIVGSFWHEVWPTYCNKYVLVYSSNPSGSSVSTGDQITLQQLPSGTVSTYSVIWVATDIVSTPLPVLGDEYDHCLTPGYDPTMDPTGTLWHELYPNYCDLWVVDEFRPNGTPDLLDLCDTLKFVGESNPDSVLWKHVEHVTSTIELVNANDTLYLDYLRTDPVYDYISEPIGSWYHEVYPGFCIRYNVVGWNDNGNGFLDSCDYLDIIPIDGPDSGTVKNYHCDGVHVDIVTTIIDAPSCCRIRGDIDHSGSGPDIADLVYLVAYMFNGGPPPPCMEEADINGDGLAVPDISDLVYLVAYMFQGGPAPVPCP